VRSYPALLLTLAAVWSASYLFIKIGVDGGLSPAALMGLRTLIAAVALLGYLVVTIGADRTASELRAAWREVLVLGALNAAIPFWLVGWGETHVDSGIAAIAQATVPVFSLLIGLPFLPHERIGRLRVAGVFLGFVGVTLLVGGVPDRSWSTIVGTLAVVLSSVFYASAGIYGQLRVSSFSGPVLGAASMIGGTLYLAPAALLDPPSELPSTGAIASVIALGLLGSALSQLLLFRVIALYGARRLTLVTYLMPGFAVVYGAVLLDEPLTAAALGGMVLILVGAAFGSGAVDRSLRFRRVPVGASPSVPRRSPSLRQRDGLPPRR
jgi:drug/metabolite transporter (DMT)-like permease